MVHDVPLDGRPRREGVLCDNPNEGVRCEPYLNGPYVGINGRSTGSYEKVGVDALLVVNRWIADVNIKHSLIEVYVYRTIEKVTPCGVPCVTGLIPGGICQESICPTTRELPSDQNPFAGQIHLVPVPDERNLRCHVGSNQTRIGETKRTHSTLVVRGRDDIRSTCHIPIVGPMDDASGPTYENHTEASGRHERVPADHTGQPRKNRG